MADALCGPSNPLQQFKSQTQLDRTLQQDRLTFRQSPAQGFRSANPQAGHLDPEFEAFQAGVPPSELPNFQPFQQHPQNYGGPSAAPSWAADFQRMHISSPPPFQQQRMQQGPSTANWAQGFREHVSQTPPRAQTSAQSPQQFQQMARFGGVNGFQSSFAQTNVAPSMQTKGKESAMEQFDEAAFERAFDQARDDMMGDLPSDAVQQDLDTAESSSQASESTESAWQREDLPSYQARLMQLELQNKERLLKTRAEQDAIRTNPAALEDYNAQLRLLQARQKELERSTMAGEELDARQQADELESMQDPHQVRQDALEEQQEAQEPAQDDDDALAATAQELLEKVQHNQTDKFRNSQFLTLMRKLRDREVKVDGDKMVETNSASTAAATETQTLNSPSAPLRFDNSEQRPAPLRPDTVDTRPYEYGIPHEEQDHDAMRGVNPRDGQEVVDMLNQPGTTGQVTDDIDSEFLMTSPYYQPGN